MKVDQYLESQVHQVLAEDDRLSELSIQVVRLENKLALVGEVESAQRRDLILAVLRERLPDLEVHCDIGVTRVHEPEEVEEL
jgi:hypothetical protein